jgi:GrpB-like predicted nucleotidyltransferase (UPF0157 family)
MRNIRVVAYDLAWPAAFEQEALILAAILGDGLITIHHIGSTAVPGLPAKPVIDMMPLVRDIEGVDRLVPVMSEAGYYSWGEHGIPGRRLFTKGGDEHRTHNVHIFQIDNPEVSRHLDFRDYLRAHPQVARQYAQLKMELAPQFPNDITAYNQGKDSFIKEMERRAREWREGLALADG